MPLPWGSSAERSWPAGLLRALLVAVITFWIAGGIGFEQAHPRAAIVTTGASQGVWTHGGAAFVDGSSQATIAITRPLAISETPSAPAGSRLAAEGAGDFVSVFHGSLHDSTSILENGLDASRAPTWASRDIGAARDAIGPGRIAVEGPGRDPGIIESRIPRSEFDQVLGPSERPYGGFFGSNLSTSEIVLRTEEQIGLFNRYIVGLSG